MHPFIFSGKYEMVTSASRSRWIKGDSFTTKHGGIHHTSGGRTCFPRSSRIPAAREVTAMKSPPANPMVRAETWPNSVETANMDAPSSVLDRVSRYYLRSGRSDKAKGFVYLRRQRPRLPRFHAKLFL